MAAPQLLNFVDNSQGTSLQANVTTTPPAGTVESWSVGNSAGFPTPPFEFCIDLATTPELCLCETFISATQWQVVRGWDNSTPVIHNSGALITLDTSAYIFQVANQHITSDPDHHFQYMRADGGRHDSVANHTVGQGPGFSINTNNVYAVPPSHWGDVADPGISLNPANSMHIHGRESYQELTQGIWAPGTQVVWAGGPIPPGWLACKGLDVRTDLAPQLFQQLGFGSGTAIDWYPPAPVFPIFIGENQQTLTDQYAGTRVTVDIPYVYMWDPRQAVMYLPKEGVHTYLKTPNYGTIPGMPSTVQWIIKADYGYNWSPRPKPPSAQPLYVQPYAVDHVYPQAVAVDSRTTKIVSNTKYTNGKWTTGFTWGYDAVMGIPVVMGSGYIGPNNHITGPFLVSVYPYGAPLPAGTMLFPDATLAENVAKELANPPAPIILKIVPLPPPPPPPPPSEPPCPPPPRVYTVVPGDNLYDIAHRFSIVPWQNIEVWNPQILRATGDWNLIYAGMKVYLGPSCPPGPPPATYIVRPGDNLYDIGLRFGLSLDEIEDLNAWIPDVTGSFNLIYPGMQIYLRAPAVPNTYVVQYGDNLSEIAERFGLTLAQIETLNWWIPSRTGSFNLIYAGMILNLR